MEECTFVILGATGDLTRRKLIPAIYRLVKNKKIGNFAIIGAARSRTDIRKILSGSKRFIKNIDAKVWKKMEAASYYVVLDFYDKRYYPILKDMIDEIEKKHNLKGDRLFYFATLPQHFDTLTENISKEGIARGRGWSRIVYEKPFGEDLSSAKRINRCISRVFKEEQVYRIDHYLGKELVGNVALVRFTNRVLEPLWNNKNIESIQILLKEKVGIGSRGEFYDKYGALKDVVQNHMLQMLALVAMEAPKLLEGDYIRDEKAKVLKRVKVNKVILGQYRGYKKEKGVKRDSNTETFAAVKLYVDNPRWRGVPFYLKTGKNLDRKDTSIHIKFKEVDCLLSKNCPSDTNHLIIRVQPDEGISMELNVKAPGIAYGITPAKMDFCHNCVFGPNTPEAYEVLLYDAIVGDRSVFVRGDEIEHSWKVVDMIKRKRLKVYPYKKGSKGPKEADDLAKKEGMRWRG